MIAKLAKIYSRHSRCKRSAIFKKYLNPSSSDKILDLGSGDGSYMAEILPFRNNVYIADISADLLEKGKKRFGFKTVLINKDNIIPYPDNYFDIVFCSSVIEHLGPYKKNASSFKSKIKFLKAVYVKQIDFANEIRRIGKCFFVQTPNKYFPVESHTWFPFFIVFLPYLLQIKFIKILNKIWPKKSSLNWNLLSKREMQALFPDANIILERSFGLVKSIMAVKA